MLNRTIAPKLQVIDNIDFVAPRKYALGNGIKLYHMKDVPNETARFDLYFDAGKFRAKKGIPSFVNGLLLSGTATKNSVRINEEINEKGGFFESGVSVESAVISMHCLREFLLPILSILTDALVNVTFHEKEVLELLADRKQQFKISQEKVSYLSQRAFQKELFSSNEAYSSSTKIEDFDNVSIADLKQFHQAHYLNGLQKVVVVGDLSEGEMTALKSILSVFGSSTAEDFDPALKNNPGEISIEKKDAVQSAIRVGRTLFTKNHPDYLDFLVVNTILGDYFGSRLMTNIREDKGYTYGIGSMIAELNASGYFLIATEVGKDVKENALAEIKLEIDRLRTEPVQEGELALVRNYMLGQLLKSADGPYAMTDLFLSVEMHGKDLDFYNEALESLHKITPERIQELANTYLRWEDFSIVTAG